MEHTKGYIKLTKTQLEKVGNTGIYLANKIPFLSKTKLLKLLYILDELSIKRSGIPFANLKYKVWKFGPVSEEIFIDLSTELKMFSAYLEKKKDDKSDYYESKKSFNDDEFTDADIELMDEVIETFGNQTSKELVKHTHRKNAPWYNAALRNNVLEPLNNEETNNTEFLVDLTELIAHDSQKQQLYQDYQEMFG